MSPAQRSRGINTALPLDVVAATAGFFLAALPAWALAWIASALRG